MMGIVLIAAALLMVLMGVHMSAIDEQARIGRHSLARQAHRYKQSLVATKMHQIQEEEQQGSKRLSSLPPQLGTLTSLTLL